MFASLFWNYLSVSIGIGIAALAFLLFQKKLRSRNSAASLSAVWITMVCCLLLPIGSVVRIGNHAPIELTVPSAVESPTVTSASVQNQIDSNNELPVTEEIQPDQQSYANDQQKAIDENTMVYKASNTINWPLGVSIVWLAGVIVFLIYQGIVYLTLRWSIRRNSVNCSDEILKMLDSVKRELSIQRNIRIGIYASCKSPFLIGLLRPRILLPEKLEHESLEFVLRHELVHYKNHDIFIKLLSLLANALHFYNPMAYVIRHQISLSRELVCDERTLRKQNTAYIHAYGTSILNSQLTMRQEALTTQFGCTKSEIKERLSLMLSFRLKKKGIVLIAVGCAAILTASTILAFSTRGSNSSIPAAEDISSMDATNISDNSITDTSNNATTPTDVSAALSGDALTTAVSLPVNTSSSKTSAKTTTNTKTISTTINEPLAPNSNITNFTWHSITEPALDFEQDEYKEAYRFINRTQMVDEINNLFGKDGYGNYSGFNNIQQSANWIQQYDDSFFQTKNIVLLIVYQGFPLQNNNKISMLEMKDGVLTIHHESYALDPNASHPCTISFDFLFIEVNKADISGVKSINTEKTIIPWKTTAASEAPAPDGKITNYTFDYYTRPGSMEMDGVNWFRNGYLFTDRQQMMNITNKITIDSSDKAIFDSYTDKYNDSYFQTKSLILLLITQPEWYENTDDGYITVSGVEIKSGKLNVSVDKIQTSPTVNCAISTDIVFIEVNREDVAGIQSMNIV